MMNPRSGRVQSLPSCSLRQLFASLLAHQVLGVPLRPVLVAVPHTFFVLSVSRFRTAKRARQIVRRGVCSATSHTPGQPRRNLLQQPAVAVRVTERGKRLVAAMLGVRTIDPEPPKQVRLVRASVHTAAAVEHVTDRDAATTHFVASGLDIGRDQVQALSGAGCCRGDVLADNYRAPGARRCELDRAPVVTSGEVAVEPPSEARVELLGTLHKS
jgi:hypothetical protein